MLKKLLLAGSCICLLACGEQTGTDSSNAVINTADGSNQSSSVNVSNRPTVTAQQLIEQPRDYIFKSEDGFGLIGSDTQCAGVDVDWMVMLDDIDFFADKDPITRLDDQTLDVTLQTKTQGEQRVTIDREQLKLQISILEFVAA